MDEQELKNKELRVKIWEKDHVVIDDFEGFRIKDVFEFSEDMDGNFMVTESRSMSV